MLRHSKILADVLTVGRVLLAIYTAGLGLLRGAAALPNAMLAVVLSWFTDLVDGPLARLDANPRTTWIGEHDAEVDAIVALGVYAYLIFSGFLNVWLGIALVLGMVGLGLLHSYPLAWPFYVLPFAILIFLAFKDAPILAWLSMGYLLMTLVVSWSRARRQHLPDFLHAISSLRRGDKRNAPRADNGQS